MRKFLVLAVLVLVQFSAKDCFSYSKYTHQQISIRAVNTSILGYRIFNKKLGDIGLEFDTFVTGQGSIRNIYEWIEWGSADEDDLLPVPRPVNHFYNPIDEKGLSIAESSLEWAMETKRNIQNYSYQDAKIYYKQGLTASSSYDRVYNLAQTFYALGHVIHLVQDLASPLHVRNDPHPPWLKNNWNSPPLYEEETNNYAILHNQGQYVMPYSGYDAVYSPINTNNFDSPEKFWKNSTKLGLAEFTNHNFLSAGTNFDQLPFTFQYPEGLTINSFSIQDLCSNSNPPCPSGLTGEMFFISTLIKSNDVPSGTVNPRASTESLYSADLTKKYNERLYTLNRFNFQEAHKYLIPRAVGYSAGLLNYFFRGSIDASLDANGTVIVSNTGSEGMEGYFTLYYDDSNGNRKGVLKNMFPLSIGPNGNGSLGTLVPPTSPAPKEPGKYILVFQGKMGMENDAVAGKIVSLVLKHKLEIKKSGNGSGSIDSVPQGMTCDPTTCWAEFETGTAVDISANADQGSTFSGWSGDCSGSSPTFSIEIDGDKTCEALFERPKLTVSRIGSGSGSIVSLPIGIDCGATCQSDFDVSSVVRLTAKEDKGSRFAGWEGDCAAGGSALTFDVIMTGDKSCAARFEPSKVAVRLNPYGSKNYSEGPFRVEVVDDTITLVIAPQDVTVTLLRQVFSQCRGLLFSSNRTVIIPQGQVSTSYDFTAGPDPFCNTLPIRTELTITGATLGSNIPLDLSNVPSAQRKIGITR